VCVYVSGVSRVVLKVLSLRVQGNKSSSWFETCRPDIAVFSSTDWKHRSHLLHFFHYLWHTRCTGIRLVCVLCTGIRLVYVLCTGIRLVYVLCTGIRLVYVLCTGIRLVCVLCTGYSVCLIV
jgi:hypothetical protein